jgi:hypothetical protein
LRDVELAVTSRFFKSSSERSPLRVEMMKNPISCCNEPSQWNCRASNWMPG